MKIFCVVQFSFSWSAGCWREEQSNPRGSQALGLGAGRASVAEISVTWRNGGLWWHRCVPITFPSCSAYLSVCVCVSVCRAGSRSGSGSPSPDAYSLYCYPCTWGGKGTTDDGCWAEDLNPRNKTLTDGWVSPREAEGWARARQPGGSSPAQATHLQPSSPGCHLTFINSEPNPCHDRREWKKEGKRGEGS